MLRVIDGGRSHHVLLVPAAHHDEMHLELTVTRAERLAYAARVLHLARAIERAIVAGSGLAATWADQLERLSHQEERRALAMDTAPCACGESGSGHGDADDDVVAVPVEQVA